jgi:sterol desaturase/sphingolipid hydroxylase (fatty acid hydroxylase superfamily)
MFDLAFHIFYYILCYDAWFYISHVILHNKNIYFIHKIHHTPKYNTITYSDAHNAHTIENIVQQLGLLIPCFTVGLSAHSLVISYTIISIRGLMRHDDRCSWLTWNHHLLHHKDQRYNFGEYWLDKLCGTLYPNEGEYVYGFIYT